MVETGTNASEGELARGEKEPGSECRTGFGNTRGTCGVEVRIEDVLSVVSGSVELLEEGSGLRIEESSSGEGESCCFEVDTFLLNCPDKFLGGSSLGFLGMGKVTEATAERKDVGDC
jgi:hypothetical protein